MILPLPRLRLLSALAPLLLVACAAQGDFPSLAPRAIERDEAPRAAAPAPAADPDPQLLSRIAALLADARRGQEAFEAVLPAAASASGAAGEAGSEIWVAAQQAISRLEAARAPSVIALAELDRLAIVHAGTVELPAIAAAVRQVRELTESQGAQIDALRARLRPL